MSPSPAATPLYCRDHVLRMLRFSNVGRWSPHIPRVYRRHPELGDWGAKGRMPMTDRIDYLTFRKLDDKAYDLPYYRDATAKVLSLARWTEVLPHQTLPAQAKGAIASGTRLPVPPRSLLSAQMQRVMSPAATRNVALMPRAVFADYVAALRATRLSQRAPEADPIPKNRSMMLPNVATPQGQVVPPVYTPASVKSAARDATPLARNPKTTLHVRPHVSLGSDNAVMAYGSVAFLRLKQSQVPDGSALCVLSGARVLWSRRGAAYLDAHTIAPAEENGLASALDDLENRFRHTITKS